MTGSHFRQIKYYLIIFSLSLLIGCAAALDQGGGGTIVGNPEKLKKTEHPAADPSIPPSRNQEDRQDEALGVDERPATEKEDK